MLCNGKDRSSGPVFFVRELGTVVPRLVPGIHVLLFSLGTDVDGRDIKPGHDEEERVCGVSLTAASPSHPD
jgi:hypothetical protein